MLLDFGSARQAIGAKSRSVTTVVTPGYAPIEQYSVRGNQGPWTDLYALGGVCYRALTGQVPDDATDRVRRDPLVPIGQVCGGQVSAATLGAIEWALQVDEEERPQSVEAWREALVDEAPSASEGLEVGSRAGKFWGGVVGLCLLLAGLGGYWALQETEEVQQVEAAQQTAAAQQAEEAARQAEIEQQREAAAQQAEEARQREEAAQQAEEAELEQQRTRAAHSRPRLYASARLRRSRLKQRGRPRSNGSGRQPCDRPKRRRRHSSERAAQQIGRRFKDCTQCPELVIVPAGSFTMGSAVFAAAGRNRRCASPSPLPWGSMK